MSFFEWTVRMVLLVLAGLVTLAILGSIHAMSTDTAAPGPLPAGRWVAVEEAAPQPTQPQQPQQPAEENASARQAQPGTAASPGEAIAAAPPRPDEDLERWLEAIAYALLALAGLAAIGLILLGLLVRQTKRLADAAHARAPAG